MLSRPFAILLALSLLAACGRKITGFSVMQDASSTLALGSSVVHLMRTILSHPDCRVDVYHLMLGEEGFDRPDYLRLDISWDGGVKEGTHFLSVSGSKASLALIDLELRWVRNNALGGEEPPDLKTATVTFHEIGTGTGDAVRLDYFIETTAGETARGTIEGPLAVDRDDQCRIPL